MRKSVPFIGEELIVRADDDTQIATNKAYIDDVLWNDGDPVQGYDATPPTATPPVRRGKVFTAIAKAGRQSSRLRPTRGATTDRYLEWLPINNGHCLRITINGATGFTLFDEWKKLLRETAESGVSQFEFNLAQLPELSLTGLGMLLYFRDQKKSRRQDIRLSHCNAHTRELLQWTGMEKYFVVQGASGTE
jgi:anti-anti-sigma factor